MEIAIVTTGDEIMAGNVLDTNAAWMSDHCWKLGAKVVWRVSVADDAKAIGEACLQAAQKADFVLVTGGLGPTVDDITLEAAAKAFGKRITLHKALPNRVGSAPGCQIQFGKATFFFLPGVPRELYSMFEKSVLPRIREKLAGKIFFKEKILRLFGAPEATLDSKLKGAKLGDVRLSFRVRFPEVWIKLACWGRSGTAVEASLAKALKNVTARVGEYIYGEADQSLPQVVGELLKRKKETLAVAESCTGGFLSNFLTDIPGASRYFERGVVAYGNRAKEELLGVKKKTLERFGAVSEEVAKEMAQGVREKGGATYGLALTGIAGPGGGAKEKPVGTVYIALADPLNTQAKHFCFPRDRLEFKALVAFAALDWLRKRLL